MQDHESAQRLATKEDGAIREEENNQQQARRNAPEVLEHESAQQASAREEQAVRDRESRRQAAARSNRTLDMACKYIEGGLYVSSALRIMECTLRSWLRVPSPIVIDARDEEKMLCQRLTLICQ